MTLPSAQPDPAAPAAQTSAPSSAGEPPQAPPAEAQVPPPVPDPFPAGEPFPAGDPFPVSPPFPATNGPATNSPTAAYPAAPPPVYPAASDPYTGGYDAPTAYSSPAAYPPPAPSYGYVAPAQQLYAYVDPAAPHGYDPVTGRPLSDKSRIVAGLLQLLPGFLFSLGGIGRLYAGNTGLGVAQLVVSVIGWISFWCGFALFLPFVIWFGAWLWFVVDGIVLLAKGGTDAAGRVLRS